MSHVPYYPLVGRWIEIRARVAVPRNVSVKRIIEFLFDRRAKTYFVQFLYTSVNPSIIRDASIYRARGLYASIRIPLQLPILNDLYLFTARVPKSVLMRMLINYARLCSQRALLSPREFTLIVRYRPIIRTV